MKFFNTASVSGTTASAYVSVDEPPVELEKPQYAYLISGMKKTVYKIDENRTVIEEFYYPDEIYSPIVCEDEVLFYADYEYTASSPQQILMAYNLKTRQTQYIYRGPFFRFMDIYNGKIVLSFDIAGSGRFYELSFDAHTFEQLPSDDDFYSLPNSGNDPSVAFAVNQSTYGYCRERMMDLAGFILLRSDNGIYTYDGHSAQLLKSLRQDNFTAIGYGKNTLVYLSNSTHDYGNMLHEYDFATKKDTVLTENVYSTIGQREDKIYFYTLADDSYGREIYNLSKYDLSKNEFVLMIPIAKQPGCPIYLPITNEFAYMDDSVFVEDYFEDTVQWCEVLENANEYFSYPMYIGVIENEIKTYGGAEAFSDRLYCEICRRPYAQYYGEYFVLDESLSAFSHEINEKLRDDAAESFAGFYEEASGMLELYGDFLCESHADFPTYEEKEDLSRVELVGENCIAIDTYGSWYGGGAHGMPYENHYLINLATGEFYGIEDLLPLSCEEYKAVVAEVASEDFEGYVSQGLTPNYDGSSSKEVYDIVYAATDFSTPVEFCEGGIMINFQPYVIGSYAAGVISFFVPYARLQVVIP